MKNFILCSLYIILVNACFGGTYNYYQRNELTGSYQIKNIEIYSISSQFSMVPIIGFEPMTYALRVRCTTNCAKSANKRKLSLRELPSAQFWWAVRDSNPRPTD